MRPELLQDEAVARRVLGGEQELYAILVKRHQKMIYSIGMRFFRNDFDSMDFTQDVFIRAYDSLSSFRGSGMFKYWLAKIAVNHAKNLLKKKRTECDIDSVALGSGESCSDDIYSESEISKLLLAEIEKLPLNYKICLDLFFFSGFSYKEISEITGIKINTIKSNVLRAKNILRDSLKGTIAEEYDEVL